MGAAPAFINFEGTGVPGLYLHHQVAFGDPDAGATDSFNFLIQREARYAGGRPFFNNEALLVETDVSPGAKSFEWNGAFILKNHGTAEDGSQNSALQCTAYKLSTGITFCFNAAFEDTLPDPTTTAIAQENDVDSVGTDRNAARVNIDLWGRSIDGKDTGQARVVRINSDAHTRFGDVIQFNLGRRGCTNFINDVATGSVKLDCNGALSVRSVSAPVIRATAYIAATPTSMANLRGADPIPSAGDRALVKDAVSCAFNAPIVGGGNLVCPAYYDGKRWLAG